MSVINERNMKIIAEFRANQGRVGGSYAGRTLLLLHTKGAKSKQERINPLSCIRDGDRLVVIAAKAGAPTHPDWYYIYENVTFVKGLKGNSHGFSKVMKKG